MSDLIGQTIDRYQILEQLGQGGMATVYLAYDARLDRKVAVKVIRQDVFPPAVLDKILKRFEREAKALARLNHPNIVGVIDYGNHNGSPFLVMPFIPSGTLKEKLGKPIHYADAAQILTPIARALAYAHAEDIVHRDVKPSNILITRSGEPVLTDFGIAKILEEVDGNTLTSTGMGLGTPEYMAPEQWRGKADASSDQYALGVIYYEMITGQKPFTADTPPAVMLKQAIEPLPSPSKYLSNLPEEVELTILKMMAKESENRFPGMNFLVKFLEKHSRDLIQDIKTGQMDTIISIVPGLKTSYDLAVSQNGLQIENYEHELTTPNLNLKEDIETRIDFLEETTDLETLPDHFSETNLEQREISSRFKMDRKHMGEIANNRRLYIKPFLVMASLMATIIFMMILINNFRTQSFISTPSETTMQIDQSTNEVQITSTIKSSSTVTVTITKTIEPTFAYTSTPMLGIGSEMISEIDRMEMIFVPAGIFVMGSNDGEFDEKPSHEVYLNDYWIDKFEVNHKQFSDFVSRTSYITDAEISGCSYFSSYKCEKNINWRNPSIVSGWINTGPDSPVIHVSWNDAIAYCSWAGRELPTEAQWEKAARGTDKRIYPWGNELPNDELANFNRNNVGITKVTMFMNGISPYGAQNMAGNVWEWVYDRYDSNYYSSQSSWINPIGPSSGSFGIIRGGSWNNGSDDLRSSRRSWLGISYTNSSIGFRCVFNPNE